MRDDDLMRVVDGLDVGVQLKFVGVSGDDGSTELMGCFTFFRIGRGFSAISSQLQE